MLRLKPTSDTCSTRVNTCVLEDKYNFRLVFMILLPYYSDETNTNILWPKQNYANFEKLET